MNHLRPMTAAVLALVGLAAPLQAGQRHGPGGSPGQGHAVSRPGGAVGHAVPRASVPVRPSIVAPYRSYGHRPYYYPGFGLGSYYGYPGHYYPGFGLGFYYGYLGHYGYPFGYSLYGYPGYGYLGYGYPGYGYGYPATSGSVTAAPGGAYGHVRILDAPRDAQVFADGYYVGVVGNFDGVRRHLTLEVGPHRIEIRPQGLETLAFDVNVQPGRTITYRAQMRPVQRE